MIDITAVHPDYAIYAHDWEQIFDLVEYGERGLKLKREQYLPFPVSLDSDVFKSDAFKTEYDLYLSGSYLVNFTKQAINDLSGYVFSREIIVNGELPESLQYVDINEIAKDIVKTIVSYGRGFVLVDYPRADDTVTIADEIESGYRAYSVIYEPLDILNWTVTKTGLLEKLERVVLREIFVDEANEVKTRIRELFIDNNIYTVREYIEEQLVDEYQPRANGLILNEIPGVFIGVDSNTSDVDISPVNGIANTNIKHYQTTAELQHAITYQGHPMLGITGAPLGFIEEMTKRDMKINVGASNALVLEGEGGNISVLEINPNLTHYKHLDELKKSIAEQGGQIKTPEKAGVESADALRIRSSGNNSTLASIAIQAEKAILKMLEYMAMFMGTEVPGDFSIDLNKKYYTEKPDATVINALLAMNNQGKIPVSVLYRYLQDIEIVDENADIEMLYNDAQSELAGFEAVNQ